ncbi:MAG: hypothetical protein KAT66_03350 [Candidatus Lokiarchaeota archaeon]|nr:hypothetical protein [Candidatus Lokiarchaeota archaeon]
MLVGSRFLTDAVNEATKLGILGIRLARFSSSDKDFYVVVEDQIGTSSSRQVVGWGTLLKKDIITEKDVFITEINGKNIQVSPVFNNKSNSSKNVIFDKRTCNELLKKEKVITQNIRHSDDEKRAKGLKLLSSPKGLSLTTATGLIYLAYESDNHRNYWIPSTLWKLKRTGKLLSQLIEEAKE